MEQDWSTSHFHMPSTTGWVVCTCPDCGLEVYICMGTRATQGRGHVPCSAGCCHCHSRVGVQSAFPPPWHPPTRCPPPGRAFCRAPFPGPSTVLSPSWCSLSHLHIRLTPVRLLSDSRETVPLVPSAAHRDVLFKCSLSRLNIRQTPVRHLSDGSPPMPLLPRTIFRAVHRAISLIMLAFTSANPSDTRQTLIRHPSDTCQTVFLMQTCQSANRQNTLTNESCQDHFRQDWVNCLSQHCPVLRCTMSDTC